MTPFFREGFGRPTKELYTVLGVLLFQQMMDLSDAEAINQLSFNIQWHYALNLYEESDEAKYISEKTLWSMRQLIIRKNLDAVMFENISDKLSSVFKVNTDHSGSTRYIFVPICAGWGASAFSSGPSTNFKEPQAPPSPFVQDDQG